MMSAELMPTTDLDGVERSADPAGFVVQACQRAKAWLREALEHGKIEQIAEIKSQAEAVRVYSAQKQLGKDAQLAAAEIVRRADRGIGVAIRRGQQAGEISTRADGEQGAYTRLRHGVIERIEPQVRKPKKQSPREFFRNGDEWHDTYVMTDGVSDEAFEAALAEARAEGNLSRANIVRKLGHRRGEPDAAGGQVPDPADRSAEAAARRRELIGELAAAGLSSQQIGARLGIGDDRVRQVAREHGIAIRADAVLGRTRRPDSGRILRQTAHALEGLAMGVALADPAGLDPAETAQHAASMARSLRTLTTFLRQIKEANR